MVTVAHESLWLEQALATFPKVRVAVFGDFCLDAYWVLEPESTELSIETGLPVWRVEKQRYSLGGAGNVVANLIDLGVGRVQAIGMVGSDLFGGELLRRLASVGVNIDGMIVDESWQTMVYAKPCREAKEESRIDFGGMNALTPKTLDLIIELLDRAAAENDVVVLNQQVPQGISSEAAIERFNAVIATHRRTQFVVDARHRPELYRGAVLKLNAREAARLASKFGHIIEDFASTNNVMGLARCISGRSGKAVFVTRGESGIIAANGEIIHDVPGIQVLAKTDTVGAGDTVVAAIAASLGGGQTPLIAAKLANIAAMITVQKLQTTGTAKPAEMRSIGAEPDYVFSPELADTPHLARYLDGTEIEVIGELPKDLQIQHCIFDHDGTLSTLREGWEKIMEPMMVRAILGPRFPIADWALFERVTQEVREFIDRTTGIQTLAQMKGLADMVRRAGFTAESDLLDEHGYKRIFNRDLIEMVQGRIEKLQKGELDPWDFQVKNATELLQELHRRGIKLYLASGTDESDVIAEAEAMGYADLFEGRIFGAVGDIKVEAKRMVLERIIREHDLGGHQFATFGDGPVEMRETRKRGGLCIGVASDEMRRFGWNQTKRRRLIRAGAVLIVPDFSQISDLLQAMQLR